MAVDAIEISTLDFWENALTDQQYKDVELIISKMRIENKPTVSEFLNVIARAVRRGDLGELS